MKRTRWIPLIVYAALLVAFLGWISNLFTTTQDTLPYSKVVELFNKEQVRQFVVEDQTITMQLNKPYNGQTTITAPLADPESFRQEMHETFAPRRGCRHAGNPVIGQSGIGQSAPHSAIPLGRLPPWRQGPGTGGAV